MVIEIIPLDPLFFGDGKPFLMGEDTWADGVFPPSPSVIHGALRTLYFANHIDEFEKLINSNGQNDPTKTLRIKGMYLKDTETNSLLFPVPLDTVQRKRNKKHELYSLIPKENSTYCCLSTPQLLNHEDDESDLETIKDGIIGEEYFICYLSKKDESRFGQKLRYESIKEKYIKLESKVGIKRNYLSNTSDEVDLYRVGMFRLKNISIIVDFEGLEGGIREKGFMKLGGESRVASYTKVDNFSLSPADKPIVKGNKFKLYLATPAIFHNGWLPGWLDEGLNGIKLKLLTAAVGRYITIGGFDMKEKKPKTMYRAVPAGSVYYFEVPEDTDKQELINTFHNKTISEVDSEKGFGLSFMGVV